ncbi:hypothetical protein K2173_017391 [Erythroxylum novogranatense]|uniref:Uncharacterized protein n=1 Tax=Erythroxylum novogranatense TaxID=1862640 RepID=A0AAV8TK85_9ROSI|nr:hypothetical protein K2173_017391 [Erythroxylum novogranatense]
MGSCLSRKPLTESKSIRVVHLNGYVEIFDYPVSVRQVTGKSTKHFVCTAAQLLIPGSKPLKEYEELKQGQIYFLLPHSALETNSPSDFAAMVSKLTAIANSTTFVQSNSASKPTTPKGSISPVWNPPVSSPNRSPEAGTIGAAGDLDRSYGGGGRTWKPLLATIREKSFNRRTESQEVFDSQETSFESHDVRLETLKEDSVSLTVELK